MHTKIRPPTIADVAERAGVSIATVSRVLNGNAPVTEETQARVRQAIAELAYVPRTAARVLAGRKTFTIGLVLPEISGAFFSPMLRGIESEARRAGYNLLIHTLPDTYPPTVPAFHALGEHNTDGLIVFTTSMDTQELARLNRIGFPLVLLHQTPQEELDIPVITIENKSGAQKIVEHLIEVHGCRRIAFLRGPLGNEDSHWRERGYREALNSHNLPFVSELIAQGGFDQNEAREAIERWLAQGLEFDAVFTGDDDAATGVLAALRQAGRRVPQDVAVVGFDDVPVSRYLSPPLTTVHAPIEQVGRQAVLQLLQSIRNEPVEPIVLLPTQLVIRESCGC